MRMPTKEIKYKAWDNEWRLMSEAKSLKNNQSFMFFKGADYPHQRSLDNSNLIFLQYTGIDDLDGIEIYEWDKVKAIQKSTNDEFIGYVTFYNGGYIVRLLDDEGYYRLDAQQFEYEIVGNAFESKIK